MDIAAIMNIESLDRTRDNLYVARSSDARVNQESTNQAFSNKWTTFGPISQQSRLALVQKEWFYSLYGFKDDHELSSCLRSRPVIFDAGCGLGYKSAWFAELAPESLVIGMEYSDSVQIAAETYARLPNLLFVRGDIARTPLYDGTVNFLNCDQVLQHTEDPEATTAELKRILAPAGELTLYVYARKALPRELLDDHFRSRAKDLTHEQLIALSKQLAELGRNLSDLQATVRVPDIPLLEIRGGDYDVQRFIYWNFLKCYWNADLGEEVSISCNYDWYSPTNAARFTRDEFRALTDRHRLRGIYVHDEEACHSGRFTHEDRV